LRKVIFIILSVFLLTIIPIGIYWKLPFELTRKEDIKLGNLLIENITDYQIKYNKLPEDNDWETLEKLGFKLDMLGTNPSYETNPKGEFELVFLEGFDGPYLIWNSKVKKWKIDYPTIYCKNKKIEEGNGSIKVFKKVSGKTILFLRPSDKKFETLKNENGIYEFDSDFGFAITRTIDFLKSSPKYKSINDIVLTERYFEITDCLNCPKIIDRDSIYYGLILTEPNKEMKVINNVLTLNYENEIEDYFK
jgi:hypothetical protein